MQKSLAVAADELERYFELERLKRDVRSIQAGTARSLEAYSKVRGHEPMPVRARLPDGRESRILWRDGGLRSGPVYVGEGDDGAGGYEIDGDDLEQKKKDAAFDGRIRDTLEAADRAAEDHSKDPMWVCGEPPSKVLLLRFREILQPDRFAFDPQSQRLLQAYKLGEKAAPLAVGFRSNVPHGPGALAHLTGSALAEFSGTRTRREIESWVNWLGKRLGFGKPTQAERALGRSIANECVLLELDGLKRYVRAGRSIRRVPAGVQRRARAALGS